MIAALPMYLDAPDHSAALWSWLAEWLRGAGLDQVPERLIWPNDYAAHWQADKLLLSQACGYPLVTLLAGKVQLLGTFQYRAAGCSGADYRSLLIARAGDGRKTLAEFRGSIAAYNSTDSQSGYNALRALVAPLARQARFFAGSIASGSHRRSIELVAGGQADLAAIDCVSYALLQRHEPQALAGIQVIGQSAAAPALPLITSLSTSTEALALLRAGLKAAMRAPELAEGRAELLIEDFVELPLAAYDSCLAMQASAHRLGYPRL
jgi:ABC-type phosphate/phosphonate transport system substrate-binding protein